MNRLIREGLSWPAVCALVAAGLVLLTACGGGGEREATTDGAAQADAVAAQGDEISTVEMPTRWATGNASDLQTLLATNSTAFVGRVTSLKETRLEDPIGGGGPSGDRARVPVSVFDVRVEASLAGGVEEGSTVLIEQVGGVSVNPDGSRTRFMLDGDEPLAAGERYLFFATTKSNGSFTAAPFGRFRVSGEGTLVAAPEWAALGAVRELAGLRVEEARREIAEAH